MSQVVPATHRPAGAALESAAKLRRIVPEAVLVGGSAAALLADDRASPDHGHVVADLAARFDAILEAVETTDGWVASRVSPGKVVLGELGGIETGVRQLIRTVPLEATVVELPTDAHVRVPAPDEILQVKGHLIVGRDETRDNLDLVALADRCGVERSAPALAPIDDGYRDQQVPKTKGVATQLVRQLADPRPRDGRTTTQLDRYKGLDARRAGWVEVVTACKHLALQIARTKRG